VVVPKKIPIAYLPNSPTEYIGQYDGGKLFFGYVAAGFDRNRRKTVGMPFCTSSIRMDGMSSPITGCQQMNPNPKPRKWMPRL
jgi:hypothetical protein